VAKAERDAENKIAAAETRARSLIDDGERLREQAESEVTGLERRRDSVVAEMERLSSELTGTATQHRSTDPPAAEDPAGGDGGAPAEPAPASRRVTASTRGGS
jgi:hypothetical protein